MATEISNQATLTFLVGAVADSAESNIATTILQGPMTADKNSLDTTYMRDSEITYTLMISNTSASALSGVQIVDNLGTYVFGGLSLTPLTYIGPAQMYRDGISVGSVTPTLATGQITFAVGTVAADSNVMIIYKAQVNEYARLLVGSTILNSATFTATGVTESIVETNTISVAAYADVSIIKSMVPNPVTNGNELTYTFMLYNYGNTIASTVTLQDTFSPAPAAITLKKDGIVIDPGEYDYVSGALSYPGATATTTVNIPAATFTQDVTTGNVTVNPGMVEIVVTGII